MKTEAICEIQNKMRPILDQSQYLKLTKVLLTTFEDYEMINSGAKVDDVSNHDLLKAFLAAKQLEGCSNRTITYYGQTMLKCLEEIDKKAEAITTDDIRKYLFDYQTESNASKTTMDNLRRILSSFFGWLEEEDYILKNPVKRIHKVKQGRVIKETLSDENIEALRDNCTTSRDLAMFELLISTGIRVGELVNLNIEDIDFNERECVVFGKGDSQRIVYFDAKTKLHLLKYLEERTDNNPALFVTFRRPFNRLGVTGVERRIKQLGLESNIEKVHPHKLRRTLATKAIDKGMPIEQVQRLLGHVQIDTTMHYAMVNQANVKLAHRKYLG